MTAAPLTIHLFGPFQVFLEGEPLPRVRTRSVGRLLALLVLRHWPAGEPLLAGGDALARQRGYPGPPEPGCAPLPLAEPWNRGHPLNMTFCIKVRMLFDAQEEVYLEVVGRFIGPPGC